MKLSIGLEICEQYFKLAMAKPQGTQLKLSDCVAEPILSSNDAQITTKIVDIFQKWKIKPKSANLCLARNLVAVRNLHLPSQDKTEIMQMIDLNVARIVPYKKDEIVFGHRFLGLDEMGYTKVILAIAHTNVIRRQAQILEQTGLFVDKISLSSHGVWEWVVNNHRSEINQSDLYLLLDIDSSFTDFIIFSQTNLLFTRSINMGANSIRESEGGIGVTKLLGEIKQSLIMFYNEEMNKKPVAVFLTGAGMKEELTKTIEVELGMPVRIAANPFSGELIKTKEINIPQDVSLTGVSEVTLRDGENRIYFVLPEIQIRKSLREKTRDLVMMGSLLIYLFTILCAISMGSIYNKQTYLDSLKKEHNIVEGDVKGLLAKLNSVEFVRVYLTKRRLPLFVFSELQKLTPDQISISSVSIRDENTISVRGQATQLSDVFKFVKTIEKIEYFKNVETKSTRTKRIKERKLTEFELSFIAG